MKRIVPVSLAALALVAVLPEVALAQRPERPWVSELSGAYVMTTGGHGDVAKGGWGVGGLLGYALNREFYLLGNSFISDNVWLFPLGLGFVYRF